MTYNIDLSISHPLLSQPLRVTGTISAADVQHVPAPAPPAPRPLIDPASYGKLTLPTDADGNGSADEITAAALAAGYASEYFRVQDGAAVFTAPVNGGGRTPNAKYVRSELREQMVLGSDRDNWPLDSGLHVQRGRVRVDELPTPIGPAVVKTVVAQIHGVDAAPPIKLQVARNSAGRVTLYGIYNRTPAGDNVSGTAVEISVGEAFDYEIRVAAGVLTLTVNGSLLDTVSLSAWAGLRAYFKAGNYVQNTPDNATGRAVVTHLALSAEHRP